MKKLRFHPQARTEYAEGLGYYQAEASVEVARRFVVAIESAIYEIRVDPVR
jgi:hypothetical protein